MAITKRSEGIISMDFPLEFKDEPLELKRLGKFFSRFRATYEVRRYVYARSTSLDQHDLITFYGFPRTRSSGLWWIEMEDLLRPRSCFVSSFVSLPLSLLEHMSIALTIVNAIRDTWKPWDTSQRRYILRETLKTITLGGPAARNTMSSE